MEENNQRNAAPQDPRQQRRARAEEAMRKQRERTQKAQEALEEQMIRKPDEIDPSHIPNIFKRLLHYLNPSWFAKECERYEQGLENQKRQKEQLEKQRKEAAERLAREQKREDAMDRGLEKWLQQQERMQQLQEMQQQQRDRQTQQPQREQEQQTWRAQAQQVWQQLPPDRQAQYQKEWESQEARTNQAEEQLKQAQARVEQERANTAALLDKGRELLGQQPQSKENTYEKRREAAEKLFGDEENEPLIDDENEPQIGGNVDLIDFDEFYADEPQNGDGYEPLIDEDDEPLIDEEPEKTAREPQMADPVAERKGPETARSEPQPWGKTAAEEDPQIRSQRKQEETDRRLENGRARAAELAARQNRGKGGRTASNLKRDDDEILQIKGHSRKKLDGLFADAENQAPQMDRSDFIFVEGQALSSLVKAYEQRYGTNPHPAWKPALADHLMALAIEEGRNVEVYPLNGNLELQESPFMLTKNALLLSGRGAQRSAELQSRNMQQQRPAQQEFPQNAVPSLNGLGPG